MDNLEFPRRFGWVLAGLFACTLALTLPIPLLMGLNMAAGENGPLEWAQEAALLAAIVFSGAAALKLRGPERLAAYLAALLYLVFLLRELELPITGPVSGYLASDAFRWHEALALAVLVLPYAVARRRYGRDLLAYAVGGKGWPFLLAALLVGLGALMDGTPAFVGMPHLGTFIEETAELLGYLVLAAAAGAVLGGLQGGAAERIGGADPLSCASRGA